MNRLKKYIANACVISAVTFIMRTVGVTFQVYVARRAGAEALGLQSLFTSVYTFAMTFACSGLYLATTTLATRALANDEKEKMPGTVMRTAFLWGSLFGLVAAVSLYTVSPFICNRWLSETRAIRPLRTMALTLPFISLSTALNGYFTACRRVYKNAIVSFSEQIVRIFSTVALLGRLPNVPEAEEACFALVIGNVIAECFSFFLSFILYSFDKKRHFSTAPFHSQRGYMISAFASVALPIALSSYVRSALLSVEHALLPYCLRMNGMSQTEALSSYGILGSMAFPVVLFPAALISSFSGLLVPELTECHEKNNQKEIAYIGGRVYALSLWFSVGCSAILIFLSGELGQVIYKSQDASKYILYLAPLVPLMYLDNTTDYMLKGLGEQVYSMCVNIADSLLSVFLVWILVPRLGINGYIIAIYITEIFNASFSIVRFLQVSRTKIHIFKWIMEPLLCGIGATCMTRIVLRMFFYKSFCTETLIFHVILSCVLYIFLLRGIRSVDDEEIVWMRSILHKSVKGK